MKRTNFEQAKVNLLAGTCNKIILMLLPFITRTIFIYYLGAELLGVKSLFTSILQILNITELGVGSAITYFMYQPIVEKDVPKVCMLLNFYKTIYRKIGIATLSIGLILLPFLNIIISGEIPPGINLQIVFILYVINSCVGYFFYAYNTSLLYALQQVNKIDNINTILALLFTGVEILAIAYFNNVYIYIIASIIKNICNNICCSVITNKTYPEYKCEGVIDVETYRGIVKQVKGLLITNICTVSRNSLDSICISMFLGLTAITYYTNYYMIFTVCIGLISIIHRALQPTIGQSIVENSVEKNYIDMMNFNFLYMTLSGWISISMISLFQPFMTIWMGEEMLFPMKTVFILVLYFYVLTMGNIRMMYAEGAGLWWENKIRAIVEAITNIVLNFTLGYYWGINGIILATLISLFFINFCYGSSIVFKSYFKGFKIKDYYLSNLKYIIVTFFVGTITYLLTNNIVLTNYLTFIFRGAVCVTLPWLLYFIIYRHTSDYTKLMGWYEANFKNKNNGLC